MARVDSLPERAKEVLQTGSVIEREFSYPLVNRVTSLPEKELLSYLSALKDSELLYERGIYPQSNYIFNHSLIREVVYDSILVKRKKKLHEEIGNAIEELYRENLGEHYEVLAEHYFLSENYLKSAEYSRLAGRKAEKAASLNDAIAFAKKRIASIEQLPQAEDVEKQIVDARTVLGLYMVQMMYHIEAKEAIDPIVDLALRRNYRRRLCQIHSILGSYYWSIEENYSEAFKAFEEALKISGEVKDIITSVLASVWFGNALGFNCEFERSSYHTQRALDINLAARNLWGISTIKSILALFCYYYPGKIKLMAQITSEAVDGAEESGDIYSKAHAYNSYGIFCYANGNLELAEGHLLKAAEFCEKINYHVWNFCARFNLGEVYFQLRHFQKSKEHYEKGSLVLDKIRCLPSWSNLGKVGLVRSKVMNKEKDVDLESLYTHSRNNRVKVVEGYMSRYIGEILLNIDDQHISEAEHWIQKAIEADQRNRMMFNLGRDYLLFAELFKRKGDRFKTQENLGKAIEILKECGADGWVEKYEKELATLS
jgi:tetratricopeptide (TPR) repeat protein